jgi:predicted metal-dependent phosphoesterase TrpH
MHIDLHTHTATVSACSHIQPEEMVTAALKAGLDGICITDHVFHGLSLRHDPASPYAGYHAVRRAAQGSELIVLPGIEFTFDEGDFLVYGLDEALLSELGESYSLETCVALAHREGYVVVQAHPFRYKGHPVLGVDAIETCNGGNSDQHNRLALAWSLEHGVLGLAGSDAHQPWEVGCCYTVFDADCSTVTGLCESIQQGLVQRLEHRHHRLKAHKPCEKRLKS